MLKGFDESELLELIEGELDPKRARALRDQLAKDPASLEAVNRLRADRALLQSCRQPDLPRDFLAEMEPLLARPMLVGSPPGEYRRQLRHRSHRPVWSRVAAVAAIMLICSGALWATFSYVLKPDSEPGMIAAVDDDARSTTGSRPGPASPDQPDQAVAAVPSPADPATGTIHHYAPQRPGAGQWTASAAGATGGEPDTVQMRSAPRVRKEAAEFALVLVASDSTRAEEALVRNLQDSTMPVALVRNFNIEEAEALAEQWRLAQGRDRDRREDPEPLRAETGGRREYRSGSPDLDRLVRQAERQLRALQELSAAGAEVQQPSGQLIGSAELAPSLKHQLGFSSRGAALTVSVPLADLPALLEKLAVVDGATTAVLMLPDSDAAADARGAVPLQARWLADAPSVRAALRRLRQAGEHTVVELPVVIEIE
ncbi:MAG: hypothetical protein JSV91_08805 [Phycisphaerales bacterium]|nr:MAG: hypothetical protein JSV91_08805 [Phycisphaerales bacterium]